jgi:hypothetical protein
MRAAKIMAGIGFGRVRMWYDVGRTWNGQTAAQAYEGPVLQACKRVRPRARTFTILEDNDPSGYKSSKGVAAKKKVGIRVLEIPKRSPDLNVCDYALWSRVSQLMRRQERKFKNSMRETRAEYLDRLRRTATSLPRAFVERAIGDMAPRCKRLHEANGSHFEEGGKRSR